MRPELNGFQRMMLCAKLLTDGSVKNRFLFYYVLEKRNPLSSILLALICRVWHGR
jgi:hypothetical protein